MPRTLETREAIIRSHWAHGVKREEVRRRLSEMKMGKHPWNKGKKGQTPWNKTNIYKKCLECGIEYRVIPSKSKKSRFCSRLCQNRHQSRKQLESGAQPWNKGKPFPSPWNRGNTTWKGRRHTDIARLKMKRKRLHRIYPRQDTELEKRFEDVLLRHGIRYTKHTAVLDICRPDFVINDLRIAVFCDGCFWHNCPMHHPEAHKERREKDAKQRAALRDAGWTVLSFWEHEDPKVSVQEVSTWIGKTRM